MQRLIYLRFFFFQAEDGIRDLYVTGVQTCALPIYARYNDETGRAPLPTGYSEVLFGELFRGAGVRRGEVVVANKLWWEFWPDQSAAAELDASLARMGFEYVDVIYANPPPGGLAIADMVAAVGGLLGSGKARAWAMVNWQA